MPSKKKSKRLHLLLPATSANLGPAFDAAALAMDFYINIDAREAGEFSIAATGRDSEICGNLDEHLILNTYREVMQGAGRKVLPLSLRIANDIPIGKGCGSSAAARLAGIAFAVHFGRLRWTDAQIIGEASRREHHPDNASACWMGGLTVARMSGEAEAQVVSVRPKGKWPLLLAIPEQSLSTEAARSVLPAQYSRADAVVNIQNSMLLLAAFAQGRPELLAVALDDRIHQPYRAALCPLLPCLQDLKGKDGILGAALSGAGPSVLVFVDPRSSPAKARKAIASRLNGASLKAELLSTAIALRGARR
jgi:homoserine kinase